MALAGDFEVVRDHLWNNIRLDRRVLALVDSAPFQRLRYVRQLGHAFLVYPGATHTRFEHALGAYHLAGVALSLLAERGELIHLPADEPPLIRLAALLHDVGHYPFSHALEEAGLPSHERLAVERLRDPELETALERFGIPDVARRIAALIQGAAESPLQGLVAGSLDLDKIEYLTRDARMCGVPYGAVDVDRLLHSLTLVRDSDGRLKTGVHEKGLSALESLLFAKYEMYRNVYWHHAVRSATAMFKRLVRTALDAGVVDAAWIASSTDDALMETLRAFTGSDLAVRLMRRHLYKRVVDVPATEVGDAGTWIARDPELTRRVEDRLADELSLPSGAVLLDFPTKPEMLAVDLPMVRRDGTTARVGAGENEHLSIQRIAGELHTQARRLRVFAPRPVRLSPADVVSVAARSANEVQVALGSARGLVGAR
jgi:HD superfamily phosphohydrolase